MLREILSERAAGKDLVGHSRLGIVARVSRGGRAAIKAGQKYRGVAAPQPESFHGAAV